MPKALSPQCQRLLQEILAKGVVLRLCLLGGWKKSVSLRGEEVVKGRLWQRHASLSLHYSDFSLRLLVAMTGAALTGDTPLPVGKMPSSLGDEMVAALALETAISCGAAGRLAASPGVLNSTLCWLLYPDVLAASGAAPPELTPDAVIASDSGCIVLEALQDHLAQRWLQMELAKLAMETPSERTALGRAQLKILGEYLKMVKDMQREDLAVFLLQMACALKERGITSAHYREHLQGSLSMAEHSRALHSCAAALVSLSTMYGWVQEKRALRFFDDAFEAGQLLLTAWEPLGDVGYEYLASIGRELQSTVGSQETS